MTASTTAKLRLRAERAEEIAIGMGFLLVKLEERCGYLFGEGIDEQVTQAIRDYRQLCNDKAARERAAQLNTETAARAG